MAIVRTATATDAEASALALAQAGVRMLEISLVVPGALEAIRRVRAALPPEVLVGAGTVLDAADASAAIEHGAEFLVSPGFSPAVAQASARAGVGFYPGAATPTEIIAAWDAGATAVKVFPAGAFGPGYLRAIREPLPGIPLLAVGGVAIDSIAGFFAAGAIGVGLGSVLQSDPAAALAAVRGAR
jgi:2-dehydro-3-deoxyphosphogluconate aldolase/(4S)-4-hydroxy-2-oxoglutarate aldolase